MATLARLIRPTSQVIVGRISSSAIRQQYIVITAAFSPLPQWPLRSNHTPYARNPASRPDHNVN
ncbi:hypothetical protein HMPREF3220_01738 [Citrobacter koseri]|nr:hypothetical protein HMPREF3220_01738 [Citrobacter koseri]